MREFDPDPLGLYVVTSANLVAGRSHRDVARAAIEGGATAVQLRAPELAEDDLLALARELASLCRQAGVLFVVNDRIELAVRSGAGGVHLGQGDALIGARDRLGSDPVLGVSVENAEQAGAAYGLKADYVAVTVWSTATKPEAIPHGLEGVREVARATELPVVAIGGIHAGNASAVLEAGAVGIAVISAVAAAADPTAATRALWDVVEEQRRKAGAR